MLKLKLREGLQKELLGCNAGGCNSQVGRLRASKRGQEAAMACRTPPLLCRHGQAADRSSSFNAGMLPPAAARKRGRLMARLATGTCELLLVLVLLLWLKQLLAKLGVWVGV